MLILWHEIKKRCLQLGGSAHFQAQIGRMQKRDLFAVLCVLNFGADILSDLFNTLEALAGPRSGGFVTPLELFIFGFEDFYLVEQILKTHCTLLKMVKFLQGTGFSNWHNRRVPALKA